MPVKLRMKVGEIEVEYEGPESLLESQLPSLLEKLAATKSAPRAWDTTGSGNPADSIKVPANTTLAIWLKSNDATTNQVRKFLATAVWLHDVKQKNRLTTRDVSGALREASQTKINNPAECLNQNVGKGHCEKDGKQFYVTEHGRDTVK